MPTDVQYYRPEHAEQSKPSAPGPQYDDWDCLYRILLDAGAGIGRERLLDRLAQSVRPYVRVIVYRKLRDILNGEEAAEDIEDIIQEIHKALVEKWTSHWPIQNMKAYIGVISRNRCVEYLRREHPNRCRCYERLKYRLKTRPNFAGWEMNGEEYAGLSQWQAPDRAKTPPVSSLLQQLLRSPYQALCELAELQHIDIRAAKHADTVLDALFRHISRPIPMTELVIVFQDVWNLQDRRDESLTDDEPQPPLNDNNPLTHLLTRYDLEHHLQWSWKQIKGLRRNHRGAFLLHESVPDADMSLIKALILHRVATRAEITQSLEFEPGELIIGAANLPMSSIAEMLGLRPDQLMQFTSEELEAEILKAPQQDLEIRGMRLPLKDADIETLLGCTAWHVTRLRKQAKVILANNRRANREGGLH